MTDMSGAVPLAGDAVCKHFARCSVFDATVSSTPMRSLSFAFAVFSFALIAEACDSDNGAPTPVLDASINGDRDAALTDATGDTTIDDAPDTGAIQDAGADTAVDFCTAPAFDAGLLIANGGFEFPVAPDGGFPFYATGETFAGWTVVGQTGNVSVVSTFFSENGITFPAHSCRQSLDLTGNGTKETGVSQTVTTVAGASYTLSFWVGNAVHPTLSIYGTSATVKTLVDDNLVLTAANSDGAGTNTLVWKPFSVSFVAASNATKITFLNADPAGDTSNFLDDVILR